MTTSRLVVVFVALLVALVSAHNIITRYQFVCGPNGLPDSINVMIFNDWDLFVDMNMTSAAMTALGQGSVGSGFPPSVPTSLRLGYPPNCPRNPCVNTGPSSSQWPKFGDIDSWTPPSEYYFNMPLVPNPNYASCKDKNQPTTCEVFNSIRLQAYAKWSDGNLMKTPGPTGLWVSQGDGGNTWKWTFTQAKIAAAACPTDTFSCPSPPTTTCSIGPCVDRCNSFEFLQVKTDTVTKNTLVRLNITNYCSDSFYYAAIGMNGIARVSPAVGSTFAGTNYNWRIEEFDGTNGRTDPSVVWLRFVSTTLNGNAQFTNATGKGPAWEVFQFTVSGYAGDHPWIVQAHEGAKWETFKDVSTLNCLCTDCDTTTTACPTKPGYTGPNCDICDTSPPPGGYDWYCRPTANPNKPYDLVKLPLTVIAGLTDGGFVPHNSTGGQVRDSQGYIIGCDCVRKIFDCQPLSYCSGNGICIKQNDTCNCPVGFLPPDCRLPPPTTTPSPTTQTQATTLPGETTPVPSSTVPETTPPVTNPPCYNDGKFCTGHGTCDGTKCVCSPEFTGAACDQAVQTQKYCNDYTTCDSCFADTAAVGLNCTWCADVFGGGCVATDVCISPKTSCGATGVTFVAEPCPDDCSGSKHGVCVNETCDAIAAAGRQPVKVNGVPACKAGTVVTDTENNITTTLPPSNTSYCLCKKGWKGVNCGSKGSGLGKALAISGGVIAAIVICGVIVLIIVVFSAKKGVDWVMLQSQADANFKNNPLEQSRDKKFDNPLRE